MPVPITCTCSVCHKCKNREYNRKYRAKKSPSINTFRWGKGVLKLDETLPNKDLSLKDIYYGPSFPGSTLDPNRMFVLRDSER